MIEKRLHSKEDTYNFETKKNIYCIRICYAVKSVEMNKLFNPPLKISDFENIGEKRIIVAVII